MKVSDNFCDECNGDGHHTNGTLFCLKCAGSGIRPATDAELAQAAREYFRLISSATVVTGEQTHEAYKKLQKLAMS